MFLHRPTLRRLIRIIGEKERASLRYRFFAASVLASLMALRIFVMVGRIFDRLFFSCYMKEKINAPICIIAAPRSGTTFLHRLMCLDSQFAYLSLYHSLFPAVSLIKFIEALAAKGRVGRLLGRLVDRMDRSGFAMWDGIHPTGLREPEEDEQLFLFTLLSPSLLMFFPFPEELSHVAFADSLSNEARQGLSLYYRDALKRLMHASGSGKTLLMKNVLIHGRLRCILGAFPDMRFIHLVRHPYETIPSFISMYARFWQKHAVVVHEDAGLARILCEYYRLFVEIRKDLPGDRLMEISYEALKRDPAGVLRQIYDKFDIPLSSEFLARLKAEAAKASSYKSSHTYSLEDYGLTRELVYVHLKDVFDVYGFEH